MDAGHARLRVALGLLVAFVALAGPLVGRAGADNGQYTQYICKNPDTHRNTGATPEGITALARFAALWTPDISGCANDSGITMTVGIGGAWNIGTAGAIHYETIPGIDLKAGTIWRHMTWDHQSLVAVNQHAGPDPLYVFGLPRHPSDSGDWFCCSGNMQRGNPSAGFAPENKVDIVHQGNQWSVTAECRPSVDPCHLDGWDFVYHIWGGKMTLVDQDDPSGTASGPLKEDTTVRGTASLVVDASDQGSGVYRARVVQVNADGSETERAGGVVDANAGKCVDNNPANGDPYEFAHQRPCKLNADTTLHVDTTKLPEGTVRLKAYVEDAGGNEKVVMNARTVTVDNVPPPTMVTTPVWVRDWVTRSPRPDDLLEIKNGEWAGPNLTFLYRYKRCKPDGTGCVPIPTASGDTYRVTTADLNHRIQGEVVATNSEGQAVGATTLTAVVNDGGNTSPEPIVPKPADPTPTAPTPPVTAPPAPTIGSPGGAAPGGGTQALPPAPSDPRGPANGVPCDGDRGRLTVTFGASNRKRVPYGKGARLAVRLLCAASGAAVRGATLDVDVTPRLGRATRTRVQTNSAGRAVVDLPRGVSRTIRVGWRARARDRLPSAEAFATLLVHARVGLKITPVRTRNGRTITFLGKVPGARRGFALNLQYQDGRRWRTFDQTEVDARGSYRYRYRFRSVTRRTTLFRFRVVPARGQSTAIAIGSSPAVTVRVAP